MAKELVIESPIEERYVDYNGHKTYVKIVGERKDNGKKPLLVLHGGPGDCHNYLLDLARIADEHDRQVIFYDQTGCGKSMLEGMGEDFYTYDLWVNEYYTVIDALGLDDFHLFGNSWGGMLGMLCMMKDDRGVNSFVINSSPVLIQSWLDAANHLIKFLPLEMQNALAEAEATGDYENIQAKGRLRRVLQAPRVRHVREGLPAAPHRLVQWRGRMLRDHAGRFRVRGDRQDARLGHPRGREEHQGPVHGSFRH